MLTSSRVFKAIVGQTDFSNVYRDLERVYLVTLAKETEPPLGPRSDEVGKKKDKDKDKDKDGDKKDSDKKADEKKSDDKKSGDGKDKDKDAKKPVVVKVELDGIQDRLAALEIPPGNYSNLRLVDNRIFYLRRTIGDDQAEGDEDNGDDNNRKRHLCVYSL